MNNTRSQCPKFIMRNRNCHQDVDSSVTPVPPDCDVQGIINTLLFTKPDYSGTATPYFAFVRYICPSTDLLHVTGPIASRCHIYNVANLAI